MQSTRFTMLIAAFGLLCASPSAADGISASEPQTVVAALQDWGVRAKLETDNQGDPKITSAVSGVNFAIYFYGCDDDNTGCQDLLLSAGFDKSEGHTGEPINNWNEDTIVGAAYLDDENDPNIQHFVAGVHNMNTASFERTMERWELALGDFLNYIDW